MNVWNTIELLINIICIIYLTFKEEKRDKSGKKVIISVICLFIIFILSHMFLNDLNVFTFCLRLGINIVSLAIFHKMLYGGRLLVAVCKSLIVYQTYKAQAF